MEQSGVPNCSHLILQFIYYCVHLLQSVFIDKNIIVYPFHKISILVLAILCLNATLHLLAIVELFFFLADDFVCTGVT